MDIMNHTNAMHPAGVRHFLDLSNSHLSRSTRDMLDGMERGPYFIANTVEGWFLYVLNTEESPELWADLPADLQAVFTYAASVDCAYVYFDRDAAAIAALPFYGEE